MTFLIFLQLSKNIFCPKKKNTFLEIKSNFSLTKKYFLLTNFFNNKQTQKKNLKFIFHGTNQTNEVLIY